MEKQLLLEALKAVEAAEKAVQEWRNHTPSGGLPSWERLTSTLSPREGLLKTRIDIQNRLHGMGA
jgi:hypothetical protein